MLIIKHRVNEICELQKTPKSQGVEIDVQFSNGQISLGHDPGLISTTLKEYLKNFEHQFLSINVKQEGIENEILNLIAASNITDYFLFDLSFPSIMNMTRLKQRKVALRISDLECIRNLKYFYGKVDWVWLDSFHNLDFLTEKLIDQLANFKVCLVSPELHSWRGLEENMKFLVKMKELGINFDAVCTKNSEFWINV